MPHFSMPKYMPNDEQLVKSFRRRRFSIDAIGIPLVAIAILMVVMLLCSFAAHATPLGPPLDKCFPVEQREDGLKALREMSSGVQSFDAASSKKLIDTLNAQEPATSWEASQVDAGTRLTDGKVFVFFSDDKLTCLVAIETKPMWDKLADQAFGQGT